MNSTYQGILNSNITYVFIFQTSLTRMALHALSRMETRKYQSDTCSLDRSSIDGGSLANSTTTLNECPDKTSKCIICLEKFKNGQVILIHTVIFRRNVTRILSSYSAFNTFSYSKNTQEMASADCFENFGLFFDNHLQLFACHIEIRYKQLF